MNSEEFLTLCRRNLESGDSAEVEAAAGYLMGDKMPEGLRSTFLTNFVIWEKSFRNELARLRARRFGKSEDEFARPSARDEDACRAAAACFAADDPYQAELALERERWNAMERIAPLAAFDLDFIIAYRLKLAINERLARFGAEAGMAGYRHLYDDILGRAPRAAETENVGENA